MLQCNNAPSSRTPRGHQFPAAFMMQVIRIKSSVVKKIQASNENSKTCSQVAGLDKHQANCSQPLKYSHMDIAGSSGRSFHNRSSYNLENNCPACRQPAPPNHCSPNSCSAHLAAEKLDNLSSLSALFSKHGTSLLYGLYLCQHWAM